MARKLLHLLSGKNAEHAAAKYLRSQGYQVIERNRSYKFGEIDIIAEKAQQRVFAEVKYRKNTRHGTASEFVDSKKQRRLTKSAQRWIQENDPNMDFAYRFDVITIEGMNNEQKINWIPNAFEEKF